MSTRDILLKRLASEDAVLVTVHSVAGSVPREVGAWMAVFHHDALGTVGGGHLELQATQLARDVLHGKAAAAVQRYALGPSLGQCCGGVVHLRFERVCAADIQSLGESLRPVLAPVALFGGGHVGHALVGVLAPLPLRIHWVDSRDQVFPAQTPTNVQCEYSDPVQAAVDTLASGSRVLIMSFSHAEDLDVVAACLARQRRTGDLPFVGLIGSQTKWATFTHRLEARGFTAAQCAHVTCPIGVPGVRGRQPEVIAVAVAAQLLQTLA